MGLQRGFKAWAKQVATDARRELGLSPFDRLDPFQLAESLSIPVYSLSDLLNEAPAVVHLITTEPEVFSAVTVFNGRRRAIVHNDGHARVRGNSNISHELSHGLLGHPPTPAMDDRGCRIYNEDIEDEAVWLGGCLLIPEEAALAVARGRWSVETAGVHFDVSTEMVNYRVNATGARVRAERERRKRAA